MFDEGDVAYRAARGNFGLIWVQRQGQAACPHIRTGTQRSARAGPEFAALLRDDTGIDVALSQPGGFQICLSERELEVRTQALERLVAQPGIEPYAFETLDWLELGVRVPGIGPDVAGATYTALDGHVNPLRLLRALHLALRRHRGGYLPESRIERIRQEGDGFTLATRDRTFTAKNVVLAAGLGNAQLAPQVGLAAPVRPQRGQIIVLERSPAVPARTGRDTAPDRRGHGADRRFAGGGRLRRCSRAAGARDARRSARCGCFRRSRRCAWCVPGRRCA
jgi:glycine/D-amino acid oxidase-like deaminating enzyme